MNSTYPSSRYRDITILTVTIESHNAQLDHPAVVIDLRLHGNHVVVPVLGKLEHHALVGHLSACYSDRWV